ncbi:MAG: FAD:protein FMN transferase [Pseudohongiellaceae bacterium]
MLSDRRRGALALTVFLLVLTLSLLWSEAGRTPVVEFTGHTMGTTWSVQLPGLPVGLTESRISFELGRILERLDRDIFSTYSESSQVSRFNAAATGELIPVALELIDVINYGREIGTVSDGAFDITVGPLVNLWGFGPAPNGQQLPSAAAIVRARSLMGSDAIAISHNPPGLTKSRAVELDLSAIAKGFAVDMLAWYLANLGVTDYLVEIGGEVKLAGASASRPWQLAIEAPRNGASLAQQAISNKGEVVAFAASGDYRNFFSVDGQRYSHVIDPRTGRPISHKLVSVTVASANAVVADGLATALLILGPEEGWALAERLNLAAYFIMRDAAQLQTRHTQAFARYLE